jgi:hypothetical protein
MLAGSEASMSRGRQDWAKIAAAWERSGEQQRAFAERHGVALETLRSWIYRLRRERPKRAKLVELKVARPSPAFDPAPVELALPNGMMLRIAPGTDASWISTLARSLLA